MLFSIFFLLWIATIPGMFSTFNSNIASMPSFSNKTHFFLRTLFVSNAATGGVITKIAADLTGSVELTENIVEGKKYYGALYPIH